MNDGADDIESIIAMMPLRGRYGLWPVAEPAPAFLQKHLNNAGSRAKVSRANESATSGEVRRKGKGLAYQYGIFDLSR
jgi:hypothetical protein